MSRVRSAAAAVMGVGLSVALATSLVQMSPQASVDKAPPEELRPTAAIRQTASLAMHPQIAQAGLNAGSPASAKSAMTAQFRPIRKGRKVGLQQLRGTTWATIAYARQNGQGRADFVAPFKRNGQPVRYRAFAVRYDGLAKVTSAAASSNKWGAPELNTTFAGTSLPAGWAHRQTTYDGLRQCAKTSAQKLKVADGTLRLSVTDDPNRGALDKCQTEYGNFDYRLTGQASTEGQRSYRYGYAAARVKFQPRRGQHGAFWLQTTQPTGGAEIDTAEWFGSNHPYGGLTNYIHYKTSTGATKKVGGFVKDLSKYGSDWAGKYHVFSVEWTPTRYVFRIDGKETRRVTQGVSRVREFLVLSLQSNIYEMAYLDGNAAAPHNFDGYLPQHMYVDWVRYWER